MQRIIKGFSLMLVAATLFCTSVQASKSSSVKHPETNSNGFNGQVQRVLNLDSTTFNNALSPDGQTLFFTQVAEDFSGIGIYTANLVDGIAQSIQPVRIQGIALQGTDVMISPDGERLFYSARSAFDSNDELADYNLYVSEKGEQVWSTPKPLPSAINSISDEFYPSVTNNGDLYFARRIKDQNLDIFVSHLVNGQYQPAQRLGHSINSDILEGDAFVASDGSYLIFARMKASDALGMTDLYISYRQNGEWTIAENMGTTINSSGIDGSPFVSRDNNWLYFTSNREGQDPEKFDNSLGLYRIAVSIN